MSDDTYVNSIYRKYRDNIILVKFTGYMDTIHMANMFMDLYNSLAVSSKFFTIIDTDEYLYLYDDGKLINSNLIIKFLDENTDCNFFVPCWIENIIDKDKLFSFNPQNLAILHWSKPIVNTKIIPLFALALNKYECPTLGHTQELPLETYGKTKIKFFLAHLKNLNKYQRIRTNMNKLVAHHIIKHNKDFTTLLKLDPATIKGNAHKHIVDTLALIESIQHSGKHSATSQHPGTIAVYDDGSLKFSSASDEAAFNKLMNSDYFDLINFDIHKVERDRHTTLASAFAQGCG